MGRTTLNISLTPELQTLIDRKIASGRYSSASEVVRDALRLVEQRDRETAIEEIRAKIDEGWAESERGEVRNGEVVFAELRRQIEGKASRKPRRSRRKSA